MNRTGQDECATHSTRSLLQLSAGWLVIVTWALVLFPSPPRPLRPGLDPSWGIGLNILPSHAYGVSVVFPYGPLGYLLAPLDIGTHLAQALAFRFFWLLLGAAAMGRLLLERRKVLPVAACAACWVVAAAVRLDPEYQLFASVLLAACVSIETGAGALLAAACALGGLSGYAKVSLWVFAAALLVPALWLYARRFGLRWCLLSAASGLAAFAAPALLLFEGPRSFVRWLRLSIEVAGAYDEAMFVPRPWREAGLGALLLVLFATVAVIAWKRQWPFHRLMLVFAAPLFLAFKHSFVRNHGFHVFALALVCAGTLALLAVLRLELVAAGALAVASVFLCKAALPSDAWNGRSAERQAILRGEAGASALRAIFHLDQVRASMKERGSRLLKQDAISPEWIHLIGNGRVMPVPWEIAVCPANGLLCEPFPTMQAYSCYSSKLDRFAADRMRSSDAPDFLLVEFAAIDGRNLVLDTPGFWQAALELYQVVRLDPSRSLLLLQRRREPRHVQEREGLAVESRFQEWIEVPRGGGMTNARLDLRLNLQGWVRRALVRIEPLFLEAERASGAQTIIRLLPATAVDGLFISDLPRNARELAALFRMPGIPADPVRRFRIVGDGRRLYRTPFRVEFEHIEMPPDSTGP